MAHARSQLGTRGEAAARQYLEAKGYQVVEMNYRCRWGEIDIIARHEDTLVFVEVRSRRYLTYGTPQESLSRKKMERLIATAETYRQSCCGLPEQWRIDLAAVRVGRRGQVAEITHLENAVQLD